MDYKKEITSYIRREIEVLQKLNIEAINEVIKVLEEARERNADIYIFGNGGSAATASHICCDFNKGASAETKGKKYRFHCLSDNVPTMMAIANDISYEEVFREQLRDILKETDLVIGISGSGNSANVIHAVEYAKNSGCRVIGITGYHGGKLKQLADYHLDVEIDDMQISEDVHMIFDHLMMSCIKRMKNHF
ncbi:MAG: SIS domain-containing protein [Clostridia bacterium]|nr:SIS domain-containing protein [Clostridia bacterium]